MCTEKINVKTQHEMIYERLDKCGCNTIMPIKITSDYLSPGKYTITCMNCGKSIKGRNALDSIKQWNKNK